MKQTLPIQYKEGTNYIIDKGCANEGEVTIVALYPNGFALIKDSEDVFDFEWTVKVGRLTEVPNGKKLKSNSMWRNIQDDTSMEAKSWSLIIKVIGYIAGAIIFDSFKPFFTQNFTDVVILNLCHYTCILMAVLKGCAWLRVQLILLGFLKEKNERSN